MTTVLVLGGTSWVGGALAQEAVRRQMDVTCLARGDAGGAPAGVSFVRADRTRESAYREVVDRDWDIVIDVSRQPGQVRGAVAALGARAGHWTFVSTGSVYADQSRPIAEGSSLVPAHAADEAGPEEYGAGKVACEQAVLTLPTHLIVRAGLIGGPGDRSDRLGHYVARFALAGAEPVLVPDVLGQPMQVVDVRDLVTWIVTAAASGETGVVHGVGAPTTIGEIITESADVAGALTAPVLAAPDWLLAHDVEPWMGPRSLPLWLPPSHHGMGLMTDAKAVAMGLQRRPMAETLRDVLVDERQRGLDRARSAGLTRADEVDLIERYRQRLS